MATKKTKAAAPTTPAKFPITLKAYHTITTITASQNFLENELPKFDDERLIKALEFCRINDPDGKPFEVLEDDGQPMPEDVQRYYGKKYLNGLNTFRKAIAEVQATRAAAAAF